MADTIWVEEKAEGMFIDQNITTPNERHLYSVWGTYDANAAKAAFEAAVPSSMNGLSATRYEVEEIGGGIWSFTIFYELSEITTEEDLDTTGGTKSMKLSYGTRGYGAPGSVIPYFGGAINCSTGQVAGVDITEPTYQFSLTKTLLYLDDAFRDVLYRMTGRYNQAAFRNFDAYEVLFLGARGRKAGAEKWKLQFNFAASENLVNIAMGGGIVVAQKYGWEYLWAAFDEVIDQNARRLVQSPRAAYVEQVYLPGDFDLLGVGA